MKKTLQTYLITAAETLLNDGKKQRDYILRVTKGELTREENPTSHCCAMIVPYDPISHNIFIVHHKKAKSWVFPGGHIDKGETPPQTAIRETAEELGITNAKLEGPFGMQMLFIMNPKTPCREHYDIFYTAPISPEKITPDTREFFATKWVSIPEAMKQIELPYYKDALKLFCTFKGIELHE